MADAIFGLVVLVVLPTITLKHALKNMPVFLIIEVAFMNDALISSRQKYTTDFMSYGFTITSICLAELYDIFGKVDSIRHIKNDPRRLHVYTRATVSCIVIFLVSVFRKTSFKWIIYYTPFLLLMPGILITVEAMRVIVYAFRCIKPVKQFKKCKRTSRIKGRYIK